MDQMNCITEASKGKHLCLWERKEIEKAVGRSASIRSIARALNRSASTISREIGRGSVSQRRTSQYISKRADDPGYTESMIYFAETGQCCAANNTGRRGGKYKLFEDMEFIRYIENCILEKKWAPASILGGLKANGHSFKTMVCFKTVYNYIDRGLLAVRNIDLPLKPGLRVKKQRNREHKRILGNSIDLRPKHIDDRLEFGHFEGDCIVGQEGKSAAMTLTERKTRKGFILALKDKTAQSVMDALREFKTHIPAGLIKSITFDNGSEFARCHELDGAGTQIYFAHPYSAYERGGNENYNGIIRRYIPKGKDLSVFTQADLNRINKNIDTLPRKCLNYQTAESMFNRELKKNFSYPMG